MFLNTNNMNEGSNCRISCVAGKKRDLFEGHNPKDEINSTRELKRTSHVNSTWQKLRK